MKLDPNPLQTELCPIPVLRQGQKDQNVVSSRDGVTWSPGQGTSSRHGALLETTTKTVPPHTHILGENGVVSGWIKMLALTQHFHGKDLQPGDSLRIIQSPASTLSLCRGRAAPRSGEHPVQGVFQKSSF